MNDLGVTKTIEVRTDKDHNQEWQTIEYQERDNGWYVNVGNGYKQFASAQARDRDVRQLLRKEYDSRY